MHCGVTLICIDCIDADRALDALRSSMEQMQFERVLFLTSLPVQCSDMEVVKIPAINSLREYSAFCVHELHKYFNTSHCLIVQHDGWVMNGAAWDESWLAYDYVGGNAFWTEEGQDGKGGNGGFSLRSHRLMAAASNHVYDRFGCHPEDVFLSSSRHGRKTGRRKIFEELGFTFAPRSIQQSFCNERSAYNGEFGHHKCDLGADGKSAFVYQFKRHHLGDHWAEVNRALRWSAASGLVARINPIHDGVDYSNRLLEIIEAIDSSGTIELTSDPVTRPINDSCIKHPDPYLPTKLLWSAGDSVCYQFDGEHAKEGNKNPPDNELASLLSWCADHNGVRLGRHMSIASCIEVMANSSLFVGVCSGMSHIAHSVGIPTFIIEYGKPIKDFHRGKQYVHCYGTADAIDKMDGFLANR